MNKQIRAPEVRLVALDGKQIGVVSIGEALNRATQAGVDLVEIAPQATPPVCRLMDYGKFQFEQSKQRAAGRKKQKQVQVKEIKFRPVTGEQDYQVKIRNIIRFLGDGDKAKVTVRFRGREMMYQDQGMKLLRRMQEELKTVATVEQEPKLEGKQLAMIFIPLKKK